MSAATTASRHAAAALPATERTRTRRALRLAGAGRHLLGLAILLLAWDLTVRLGFMKPSLLPPPATVADTLVAMARSGELVDNVVASLVRVGGGFLVASAVGIALAIVMGLWKLAAEVATPVIEVLRPISPIAWIPLAILWFGLGNGPAWFVIFVASFFPVVTSTYKGVTGVALNQLRAAACCGMKRWALVWKVILPSAVPDTIAGLRTGLGIGWMAVIAAEFVSAQSGLGYQIEVAQQLFATDRVLAGMVAIGVIGFAMNYLMIVAERRIAPWAIRDGANP